MELLDIYDYKGERTGKVIQRGTRLLPGEYMKTVLIVIFNSEGKMLIQRRVPEKEHWGGLWDLSCCGAVIAGEEPRTAAMRELKEELGLTVDLTRERPVFVNAWKDGTNDAFVIHMDLNPSELTLQKEEVAEARFATEDEILEMIRQETFISYKPAWVSLLFACRVTTGTIDDAPRP